MAEAEWLPGTAIAGRYRLRALLGSGAMGEVWEADHLGLNAAIAIKLIHRNLVKAGSSLDADLCARFFREAQTAASLRSPHVVQVHDHGLHDGVPYMTMELLDGETLEQRLARVRRLSPAHTVHVVTHIARGIGRAHEAGIVHRDLKPGNVFLVHNDDEELAKVLDFGVAKLPQPLAASGVKTSWGILLGTPCYMSPEQAEGAGRIDWRSDLWSIAAIAFECMCGRRPFESNAIGEIILQICAKPLPVPSCYADVPPEFDAWWAKAAQRNPKRRFQSARELADALRDALGAPPSERTSLAPPSSRAAVPSRPRAPSAVELTHRGVTTGIPMRRSRRVGAMVAASAIALAVGVGLGGLLRSQRVQASTSAGALPAPTSETAAVAATVADAPARAAEAPSADATPSGSPAPADTAEDSAASSAAPLSTAKPQASTVRARHPLKARAPKDRIGF